MKKKHNLYELYTEVVQNRKDFYQLSFEQYLITLDFLYAINKIDLKEENLIKNEIK